MDGQRLRGLYYSTFGLFATHLQKDLGYAPAMVALPIALSNITGFVASSFWGWVADWMGRRPAMIIPAFLGFLVVPFYLFTHDYFIVVTAFAIQGFFFGGMYGKIPAICPNGSRPRCGPPQPASATTRVRSGVVWPPRCSRGLPLASQVAS